MSNKTHGMMIIISSPSGAGKTTLVKILSKRLNLHTSVSHTTRKPRLEEENKKDYFFINKIEFENLIKQNYFIEYAEVFENLYGTSKDQVISNLKKGKDVIFDIDWQGAEQIRKQNIDKKLISFFILPPSRKELIDRLSNREKGNKHVVEKRMKNFSKDVLHWNEYDYVIVNDQLEKCFEKIKNKIDLYRQGNYIKENKDLVKEHVEKLIN